jgi:hypothetical protein
MVIMKDRKEISAFLIGCEPHQLLAFKDYGDDGTAAIAPDGKKHVFDAADLDQVLLRTNFVEAVPKMESARKAAEPIKRSNPKSRTSGGTAHRPAKSAASKTSAKRAETKQ